MIATVNKIGHLSQHMLRQKPRQITTMTHQPDILLSSDALEKAARGVWADVDEDCNFNSFLIIEDGDCTHEFNLEGRMEFTKNCDGEYFSGVTFTKSKVKSYDMDFIELSNDFTEEGFKQYF